MIRWIRRHPVLTIIGLLLMPLTVRGALNLTGFCWKEKRYVPLEEKCEAAMRYTYDLYKEGRLNYFKIEGFYFRKIKNLIDYKSYEDFVKRNPNACRTADDYMGWRASFLDCLFGYCGGYARIEFAADADGIDPIALLIRERWGVFNIAISRNINKNINDIFWALDKKYRKPYLSIVDSSLSLKYKQVAAIILIDSLFQDLKKAINSIKDENERLKVIKIYEESKKEINIHSAIEVAFDNCGRVWDPIDD